MPEMALAFIDFRPPNMHINLAHPEMFRRILVFAMIYEGTPNWVAVDGTVTLYLTSGPAGRGPSGLTEQRRPDLRDRPAAEQRS